jgi:redox-sensing transcriptional repressor
VLVGVGNLARALLRYRGFREQGFEVVGLFDSDPRKVGTEVEGLTVWPLGQLAEKVVECRAELAVLTVPSDAAQPVADRLATAGVRGILNFAPVLLRLPAGVKLVSVDLSIQLEQLACLVQMDAGDRGDKAMGHG